MTARAVGSVVWNSPFMADDNVAEQPLVSICIRNYNYGRFVGEAIESCLDQTYGRVETIVVDDGSTDDSHEVLAAYEDRVRVIRQPNRGQFRAGVAGLEASSGELVIFLDSDDRLHAGTVARVVRAFERCPGAARVQWRLSVVTEEGWPTTETFPPRDWVMSDGDLAERILRRRTYVWPPTSGNAYPRRVVELVLRCLGSDHRFDDVDLPLAEATPLMGPVVNLLGTGGDYRWHGANFSARIKRQPVTWLHDRIDEVVRGQAMLVRLGDELGRPVDEDPRAARDWAFAGYRLGSLRLDADSHPLPRDHVLTLAAHGMRSVAGQPDYSLRAKLRRMAWFAATALSPRAVAERLVEQAFLTAPASPVALRGPAADVAAPARTAPLG
jgi:glycosyltransferase involved in cell wall biosynthesis